MTQQLASGVAAGPSQLGHCTALHSATSPPPSPPAGEPELAMATHVIHRPIDVLSPALEHISRYGEEYAGATVPLLFHSLGHYDLLVRAAPTAKL